MTEFESILINRDDMTDQEAKDERKRARRELLEMIEDGASYSDVEDYIMNDYGMEMDYLFDLI